MNNRLNNFYKNKRILVAGGTGVIGLQLVKLLSRYSKKIIVAGTHEKNFAKKNLPKNIKYIKTDLREFKNCIRVTKNIEYAFNLVGIKGSSGIGENKVLDFYNSMIMFQTNLFKASLENNISKYMFVSSICGYPNFNKKKKEEIFWNGLPKQNDKIPGLVKRIGEIQIEAAYKQLDWKGGFIVRPSNVYGPFDDFNPKTAQVIPSLIAKFLESSKNKKFVNIWGDGSAKRDFIFSEDAAEAIMRIMTVQKAFNYPINLGAGHAISIKKLALCLKEIINKNIYINWQKDKPTGDSIRVLDTKRLKEILPNFKTTPLKNGLIKTVDWYIENKLK